jgi:hypothetical protein
LGEKGAAGGHGGVVGNQWLVGRLA